jgi:hypothetical protein
MLVPKEMKVEHSGGVKDLTDEQLDAAITALREMLARQAGEAAKVIEREAEVLPALPTPALHSRARPCGGLQVFARPTAPTQGDFRIFENLWRWRRPRRHRETEARHLSRPRDETGGCWPASPVTTPITGSEFGGPQGAALGYS